MLWVQGKNLEEYSDSIRYADGENATLEDALAYIEGKAKEYNIELVCEKGFAEYGNIFLFNIMELCSTVLSFGVSAAEHQVVISFIVFAERFFGHTKIENLVDGVYNVFCRTEVFV